MADCHDWFYCSVHYWLSVLFPVFCKIYTNTIKKTVTVAAKDLQYASINDKVVSQEFWVEGMISNLAVYIVAPNGSAYGDAIVTLNVSQNDFQWENTVYASTLPNDGFYMLSGSFHDLKKGSAILSITSSMLPPGTDIFCTVTQTLASGLPVATMDENILGAPICIKYDVFKFDRYFWYETILLAMLLICLVVGSYLIIYKRSVVDKYNLLYIFAVVQIFLIVSIHNPFASLMGEPRSEGVYEFWYKAKNMGLRGSLMSLMSGEALVWLERVFMWLAVKIAPTPYIFVVAQSMQLLFISFVVSMPCLKTFAKYFDMEVRLMFSIFTGCWIYFQNGYYFWGVSYWAVFFLIAFAFVDMSKIKWWLYWPAMLFTVILCMSRI